MTKLTPEERAARLVERRNLYRLSYDDLVSELSAAEQAGREEEAEAILGQVSLQATGLEGAFTASLKAKAPRTYEAAKLAWDHLETVAKWIRQRHPQPRAISEAEMKERGDGTSCRYGEQTVPGLATSLNENDIVRIREIVREEIARMATQ